MTDITVRQYTRKAPGKKVVRMFDAEIQARLAAKQAAGKREPVPAPYAYPAAIYTVAVAMRPVDHARPAAVMLVLNEVR